MQEAWLRLSRAGTGAVDNLGGWLTTSSPRVCLDMLRSRVSRREEPLERPSRGTPDAAPDPEQDALLADAVGPALLVVLESLIPPSGWRSSCTTCSVLPYEEVAPIVEPHAGGGPAARQPGPPPGAGGPEPDADPVRQRRVVDAFLAAAREGDFDGLLAVLDPDVMARSGAVVTAGATAVARGASGFARLAIVARPALVDGATGLAVLVEGRVERTLAFTFVRDRIALIDVMSDPARLARLEVTLLRSDDDADGV